MTQPTFTTQRLDHLGIVAGICHRIDLIDTIDTFIGKTKRNITVGEAVMAMILNALGFVSRPLYLTTEFFSNKPVNLLINPHLQATDFTDDSLGRALDTLYENGITELFATVASKALATFEIHHRFVHLDSTTFSLHGAYDADSDNQNVIQVTHGYSRDSRPDLKQVVVQMICSYRSQIPIWLEALDGNTGDKTSFPQTIKAYTTQLQGAQTPYFIADSALYTTANIATLSNVRFITRVPETIKAVKALYERLSIEAMAVSKTPGYRYLSVGSIYGDVEQRWLVVHSESAYRREVATLEKQIAKAHQEAAKSLKQLSHKEFDTAQSAREAVDTLSGQWRYHKPKAEIRSVPHYGTRGRPCKTAMPTRFGFRVAGEVVEDDQAIQAAKQSKGKFVLATNELDTTVLDEETLLSAYKSQNVSVERGFRFLKDPLFFASSLFLEKPQRIMALLMVMGLSLLVYALAERFVRAALVKCEQTIENQVGKRTQRPTLRRIFQVFEGIDVLLTEQEGQIHRVVLNLKPIHYQILDLFGGEVKKCYIPDL